MVNAGHGAYGLLSNSGNLYSIYLIKKKHIGSLKDTRIWINSFSGRPVVDPDNFYFLLHGIRTHNGIK